MEFIHIIKYVMVIKSLSQWFFRSHNLSYKSQSFLIIIKTTMYGNIHIKHQWLEDWISDVSQPRAINNRLFIFSSWPTSLFLYFLHFSSFSFTVFLRIFETWTEVLFFYISSPFIYLFVCLLKLANHEKNRWFVLGTADT